VTARIGPGTRHDIGVPAWIFSLIAARVTKGRPPHVFTTLGRTRRLFWGWLHFASGLMPGGTLPRTDTEMLILRVAHLRDCEYERRQHARIARSVGLSRAEVERVPDGPDADGWTPRQRVLLRACDSLVLHKELDDALWDDVRTHCDERAAIELLLLVGHYDMLATTLLTLRVEPD
jgi:AhpD family alkylhydroperoxidase